MNEENNNFDISFEENNDNITVSDEVTIPGNILGDDDIIGGSQPEEDVQGPIIVSSNEDENVAVQDEPITGPIIVNNSDEEIVEKQEVVDNAKEEKNNIQMTTESFKDLESEIKNLKNEKEDVESNIRDLMKRRDELEILIKNKEVEVTTDKLKTYIKDLEVKPGAVRDALAALINNMDN